MRSSGVDRPIPRAEAPSAGGCAAWMMRSAPPSAFTGAREHARERFTAREHSVGLCDRRGESRWAVVDAVERGTVVEVAHTDEFEAPASQFEAKAVRHVGGELDLAGAEHTRSHAAVLVTRGVLEEALRPPDDPSLMGSRRGREHPAVRDALHDARASVCRLSRRTGASAPLLSGSHRRLSTELHATA